jgi:hypothetical protein
MSINDPQINIDNFDEVGRRNWLSTREIEELLVLDPDDDYTPELLATPLLTYRKE